MLLSEFGLEACVLGLGAYYSCDLGLAYITGSSVSWLKLKINWNQNLIQRYVIS